MIYNQEKKIEKLKNNNEDGFWINQEYAKYILKLEIDNETLNKRIVLKDNEITLLNEKIILQNNLNKLYESEIKKLQKEYIWNRILVTSNIISFSISAACIIGIVTYSIVQRSK